MKSRALETNGSEPDFVGLVGKIREIWPQGAVSSPEDAMQICSGCADRDACRSSLLHWNMASQQEARDTFMRILRCRYRQSSGV